MDLAGRRAGGSGRRALDPRLVQLHQAAQHALAAAARRHAVDDRRRERVRDAVPRSPARPHLPPGLAGRAGVRAALAQRGSTAGAGGHAAPSQHVLAADRAAAARRARPHRRAARVVRHHRGSKRGCDRPERACHPCHLDAARAGCARRHERGRGARRAGGAHAPLGGRPQERRAGAARDARNVRPLRARGRARRRGRQRPPARLQGARRHARRPADRTRAVRARQGRSDPRG